MRDEAERAVVMIRGRWRGLIFDLYSSWLGRRPLQQSGDHIKKVTPVEDREFHIHYLFDFSAKNKKLSGTTKHSTGCDTIVADCQDG